MLIRLQDVARLPATCCLHGSTTVCTLVTPPILPGTLSSARVFSIQWALARILRQNAGVTAPSLRVLCASRRERFYQTPHQSGIEPTTEEKIGLSPTYRGGGLKRSLIKESGKVWRDNPTTLYLNNKRGIIIIRNVFFVWTVHLSLVGSTPDLQFIGFLD